MKPYALDACVYETLCWLHKRVDVSSDFECVEPCPLDL